VARSPDASGQYFAIARRRAQPPALAASAAAYSSHGRQQNRDAVDQELRTAIEVRERLAALDARVPA